jgi:hypothetical protein
MRRMQWTACLWPGLPQLWTHGSWAGLALAIGAAVVLDALLLVSFGWTELIGENVRNIVWAAFGVCWVVAAGWSVRDCRRRAAAGTPDPKHDQFAEALDTYLKGDYYRTERILEGLLRRNLRDVDARLMLATLLRHTGRFEEAGKQLDTLTRFEGAGKWELELERERQLLAETQRRN